MFSEIMRILVISNSCLSEEESNGRILRTLLSGFSDGDLSNFALRGIPNCQGVDYQTVTDGDALRSFVTLGIRKPRGIVPSQNAPVTADARSSKARNHYIRDIVWYSGCWNHGHVRQWFNNLDVSAVFLMAADAPFLYRLARKVSKKKGIPLLIYSSEDYFLKDYDYMGKKVEKNFWCRRFLNHLHRDARKAFRHASLSMLCSPKLERSVKAAYGNIPTEVVYQPSLLSPRKPKTGPIKRIVYGGNINEVRITPLLEIAKTIHGFDPNMHLTLYGPCPKSLHGQLEQAEGIEYGGKLPYSVLLEKYEEADMLVHAEGFDDYNLLDYAHAFSTKIGDCYQSGIPFFLYGPKEIPCIQFGMEHSPEFTATNPEELRDKLTAVLSDKTKYAVDREFLADCFDASIVGKHIADRIARLVKE